MRTKQMKLIALRYALLLLTIVILTSAEGKAAFPQKPATNIPAQQQWQQEIPAIKLDTNLQ